MISQTCKSFLEAIEKCFLVIQNLKFLLKDRKMLTNVGDEEGLFLSLNSNEDALELK